MDNLEYAELLTTITQLPEKIQQCQNGRYIKKRSYAATELFIEQTHRFIKSVLLADALGTSPDEISHLLSQ